MGEEDCYKAKDLVKHKCMATIEIRGPYIDPSDSCVHAVRQSDMTCICHIITMEEETKISISKLIRLARECNKAVPSRTKCGSKYLPIYLFFQTILLL